jgi:hypothetical protein
MLTRAYLMALIAAFAVTPCHAGKSIERDGSTMEKAIRLKERGAKAVEEEMAWMTRLYGYTPLMATRDAVADAIRQIKAGKKGTIHPPQPWEHATLWHNGQWCSYWMMRTPRGKRDIYFDTGISIDTPGAVPQIESSRAQYMGHRLEAMKLQ